MASIGSVLPEWWNYKPLSKEQIVTCYQGKWVDIDFNKFLIQGANPDCERVLMGYDEYLLKQPNDYAKFNADHMQRGFLNTVRTTSDPIHGVFYRNMEYGKIRYIPFAKFTGVDCFRFEIATPWQASDEFRVMVNVIKAPYVSIYVHRVIGDTQNFKYSAKLVVGDGIPSPNFYYFIWYEFIPTLVTVNNRQEVIQSPRLLQEPITSISGSTFVIGNNGSKTSWVTRYWPDVNVNRKGYIQGTNDIYVQPLGPPSVLVRCVMFDSVEIDDNGNIVFIDSDELWSDSTVGGLNWWKKGSAVVWHPTLD